MVKQRHGPSCAAALRSRAAAAKWPPERLVDEIAECCSVSRLRAHRLALGWTLAEAVEAFRQMCARDHLVGPRLDVDQLRVWETGRRRPVAATVDLLCRLYQTSARALGLDVAADYTPMERATRRPTGGDGGLDDVRREVDRTLASATVTADQLDLLEDRLLQHRRRYVVRPPEGMLPDLVDDVHEVRLLAEQRQPASTQRRLSHMTALLATLIGDALMRLGHLRSASAWYATARTAADDCAEREVQARVRVQAAILPYYYGPLDAARQLMHEARDLMPDRPSESSAFAAIAHARALARCGDAHGAEAALHTAHDLFEQAEHGPIADALTFPARRLLLYTSGTFTYVGRTRQARHAQQQSLAMYPPRGGGIDPALLRLEEAICLVRERCLADACQLAAATYLALPPEQRTQVVTARTRHVLDALPPRMRLSRHARELGEILASLPSRR
ncbi:helix-turn-helix transcriptional regulator [Streptomyces sp. NPDC046805]|uniref:helix-turn-helix domain-containing protein n=1 Tax=Streptomyces sp. NPDC046805 TaxID=3155134 RepID=UPI00340045F7